LSTLLNIGAINSKPIVVTNELKPEAAIKAADEYLSAVAAMAIMDHYQAEALMRFTLTMSYKEMSSNANTLIDTATSLNYISNEFVMANDFFTKIVELLLSYLSEWLVINGSLRLKYCVPQFLLLMDMNSRTNSLESYLTLKGQILYWDFEH
jgi:hypothetical protein